ncbi:MAG TPA: MaoC/PaaZ C-terminal domain-containing protein [Streptomyces sp.]|nr:MaoC/PaaZ C-terminal domain-containing protein [Streptomyces sp.]
MNVQHLTASPRMPLVLARGALTSPGKRGPYEGVRLPGQRLVLPHATTDPARLRSYTRVCGFSPPDAASAPGGGAPLPASYPHILGFPLAMRLMTDRAFPFPLLGLVHTGIELTQHRALRMDDRPEISVHAEGLAQHRRGSQFDVVTEARMGGQLVWHSRSTYLCRHRSENENGPSARAQQAEPPRPLPVRDRWELPANLGRRYGAASGDRNPIHLHPLTAKLFGFPRHIAHGMWTFARALAGTGAAVHSESLTARAEFKSPVLLPSTVAFGWDEPTASAGTYRAPVRVHRFELRSGDGRREEPAQRLHLTGEVTSGPL